jgi:hypothetical protein
MTTYSPGTYAKGDDKRVAQTPADAVNLVFQGYGLVEDEDGQQAADEPQDGDEKSPDADEPVSALEGADPEFDEGSPSEENTSASLAAHQSGYTY